MSIKRSPFFLICLMIGSAFTASLPQQFAHNIEKIQDTIIGTTKDQIESIASGLNTRGQPSVADATQQLATLPLKFAQNVQQLQGPIALATQQVVALPQQFAHNIDQIQDTIVAKAKEQVAALAQAAASLRSPAKRGMVEQLASNMGMMPVGDSNYPSMMPGFATVAQSLPGVAAVVQSLPGVASMLPGFPGVPGVGSVPPGLPAKRSMSEELSKNVDKIRETIIHEATSSVASLASGLKSLEERGIAENIKKIKDTIVGKATEQVAKVVASKRKSDLDEQGGFADGFKGYAEGGKTEFMSIVDGQLQKQNMLSQMTQNGLLAKRDQLEELDDLVSRLGKSLEGTIRDSRSVQKLGSGKLDQLLDITKTFTKKLRDITRDLVSKIKVEEKVNKN